LKYEDARQSLHNVLGRPADLVVFAPRREAYLEALSTNVALTDLLGPVTEVISPGSATNLGAGSDDWVWLIHRDALPLATDGPSIEQHPQAQGTNLLTNFLIHGYASFATALRPEALAVIKGLGAPTF
jgi:hypothetical protein